MESFDKHIPEFGRFSVRKLRIPEDILIVHDWVRRDYARYWGLVGKSLEEVTAAYAAIAREADVYLGYYGQAPAFLLETYDPALHAVGRHYAVQPGDRGMHVLAAPTERPVHGFTWAVFSTVMDFLFSDPATARVVVEPDIRNQKIHALNRRAGFRYQRVIELQTKTAHLAFCERAQYVAAREANAGPVSRAAAARPEPTSHLRPEVWSAVNRALLRKAIAEFSHERLLDPRLVRREGPWGSYVLTSDDGRADYRFRARLLQLDHWDIEAASLHKQVEGADVALDALDFILEFQARLRVPKDKLPVYLEELTATLYSRAYSHVHERQSAADLVHAEFQEIESSMSEGHPGFVAGSGRVGFDAADYLAYAPEAGTPVRLVWLAADRRYAEFSSARDLSYEQLLREELGPDTLKAFEAELRGQGLDPAGYLFIPVHPWQWFNKLAITFAPDLATRALVCLGYGPDHYQAQQSIRTFFNLTHPHKRYVKTALSVLNMGFMRGLSADYMRHTPAINDWIADLLSRDPYLRQQRFGILREVAGVGYRNPYFESALPKPSPYRKMLAALYRESPAPELRPSQRLMTMAALLHRDAQGVALLPQLIKASGLDIDSWLRRYLDCYLAPLAHCFYRYDLAFMPHGENIILLLEDNAPKRAILKDIAEEAVIMDTSRDVPADVRRLIVDVPEPIKILSIFTDIFDGILRYMSQILVEQADYGEGRFWQQVAACLTEYQHAHPELNERFARHDLFMPEFARSCLNRLQLANNTQLIDLTDPAKNLQFAGTLVNPIAPYRPSA